METNLRGDLNLQLTQHITILFPQKCNFNIVQLQVGGW